MENRLLKVREKLNNNSIDAILITKRVNYMYLSGFTGTAAHLLITGENAFLITDFRYVEQATKQAPLFEIIKCQGSIEMEINNILKKLSIKNLGFESDNVTYDKYIHLKDKFEGIELVPQKGFAETLRIIKSKEEIEKVKKAVEIADGAFEHVLNFIKPGVKENEIAAELEHYIKKNGGQGPSFDTIVASGTRSAMPHGVASEKEIQAGDVVTMDYGAIYDGYCSDITRTVFVGHTDDKLKEIYEIVLSAQLEALKGAIKGKTGREIDEIAREIITKAGYGENFGHGLGHGVGLEIHEDPRLSITGERVMENGMVVTVEPGIYIEGLGGVRIEDMIVINDNQPLILTKAPKELYIL
ncbi:MAG: aminopeptidase P family protein [Clostridiaceae bacterium]|jgi:Xaa-Pro aminopeptidase|nr:aminopeptidase P family protein [Clostridiaceae bacterium]